DYADGRGFPVKPTTKPASATKREMLTANRSWSGSTSSVASTRGGAGGSFTIGWNLKWWRPASRWAATGFSSYCAEKGCWSGREEVKNRIRQKVPLPVGRISLPGGT